MHSLLLLLAVGGPLGLRTQGPLRELFLDITGADARPVGRPEIDVRWSVANTWNETMIVQRGGQWANQTLDEQADSLAVRFRAPWPWFPRVWTAFEWKLTEHWGGWSDAPIESWHSLIGSFNYQRSQFLRNQVHLTFVDSGASAFDIHSPTLAVGDFTVRTQAPLWEGPVALAARFDFKLPVGALSAAGGSGGFDAGAGLLATWPACSWATLHGLLALSRFSGFSKDTVLQPKPWHFTGELSVELDLLGTTFLIEDRILSPLLQPGWTLPAGDLDAMLSSGLYADFRAHNQISFAVRRGRFSIWLSEDFTPGSNPSSVLSWMWVSNAPDVVLGLAFTQPL